MQVNRVRQLRRLIAESFGGSQVALSKRVNVSPSQIGQYLGGYRNMGERTARKIERGSGKPLGWLDTDHSASNAIIGARRIPLISYAQAGVWAEIADGYAPSDATGWLLTDLELSAAAFALKIEDESMLPLFRPGDRVVIDPAVAPRPGDFVVAKSSNGEVMFKKYRPRGVNAQGQKVIELTPLNSDFPPVRSDTSPFVIIGTMVEHRRYRTAAAQAGGLRNV